MPKNDSTERYDRLPEMPPPVPRRRMPAGTPAPAIQEALADYDDGATEIDGPPIAQKKWLDSIETIPFDPSMRVGEDPLLGEGTPPRAVPPVRVDARPAATPRPARRNQTPRPQRAPARHPHDNIPTRLNHVDVAGGHVSFSPDPDQAAPLPAIPTPAPTTVPVVLHAPYGAPALPPHAPTAMAMPLPPQMPAPQPQAWHDVTPYPVPPWASGPGAPLGVQPPIARSAAQQYPQYSQNHLDIYSDTGERGQETLRVGALPPSMPVPSLRPSIRRYLVPLIGGTALLVFVAGYFFARGDSSSRRPEPAPIAAAAAMPAVQPPAPVVSEIVEPQLPDPSWKHREAQPTIVANAEPVAEPEIEMAPIATPKKKASPSARRAKRAQVAAITKAKAKAKAKPVKAAPVVAKKATSSEKAIARSTSTRDPILEEIERSSKPSGPKATGPGKLKITSSVPTLIYVDGRSTNLMTPKTLNLSAGTHKITLLELKSKKAKTMDINIASGAVTTVDKKF